MPVIGLVHYDEELDRNVYMKTDEAIAAAIEDPVKYGAPALVARALQNRKGVPGFSASQLFGFNRLGLYRKLVDYYEELDDTMARMLGSGVHLYLEHVRLPGRWADEERLSIEVPHPDDDSRVLTVSGQFDSLYLDGKDLYDFKTTSRIPSEPYESHVMQINTYAELVRQNPTIEEGHYIEPRRLFLVYITRKKTKTVQVPLYDSETMQEAIAQQAWWLQDYLDHRAVMSRDEGCVPYVEAHFCPFYEVCKASPDWHHIEDGMVLAEDRLWTRAEWDAERERRHDV